jgi:hypothetical protein
MRSETDVPFYPTISYDLNTRVEGPNDTALSRSLNCYITEKNAIPCVQRFHPFDKHSQWANENEDDGE